MNDIILAESKHKNIPEVLRGIWMDRAAEKNPEGKKLIYHLTNRGFFSEVNFMMSALLYSLLNGMEFYLCSHNWTASRGSGWTAYFEPFCKEINDSELYINSINLITDEEKERLENFTVSNKEKYIFGHDIWSEITSWEFTSKVNEIQELDLHGDIFSAKKKLYERVFTLNEHSRSHMKFEEIEKLKPYLGVHVRRGDKVNGPLPEAALVEAQRYAEQINKLNDFKNIYLATDDYGVVEELRAALPDRNIISYCPNDYRGYDQDTYNSSATDAAHSHVLDLLNDFAFLVNAEQFVGTFSSNLGRAVAVYLGKENCFSVDDSSQWRANEWHGV